MVAELILVGVVSFVAGAAAIAWVAVKGMNVALKIVVQDIRVGFNAKKEPYMQLCIDLPIALPGINRHLHPRVLIHPELAEDLIAGMRRSDPPTDIRDHVVN